MIKLLGLWRLWRFIRTALSSISIINWLITPRPKWVDATTTKPDRTGPGTLYSIMVLVAISCKNGTHFVAIDRWDYEEETWIEYAKKYNYSVTHWQYLPDLPRDN